MTTSAPQGTAAREAAPGLRDVWAAGDYQTLAVQSVAVSEGLCDAAGVRAGHEALDVASGTGNTALAAARRAAATTAVDFVPILLERARRRAAAEGLPVELVCADAERLPFADARFDVVLSTLGVPFVPDEARAAAELVRVCRPGGVIGLANWTTTGWAGGVSAIIQRHLAGPGALPPPVSPWSCEDGLRRLFNCEVASLRLAHRSFSTHHRSPAEQWSSFVTAAGGLRLLFDCLDDARRHAITADVLALSADLNRSRDGTLVLPHEYLEVVAVKPARVGPTEAADSRQESAGSLQEVGTLCSS